MPVRQPPREVTVLVDTNEQNALKFPETIRWEYRRKSYLLHVKTEEYPLTKSRGLAGDYTLKGWEKLTAVERKGSLTELKQNLLTNDRIRFRKALRRLADLKYPWLFLDMPVSGVFRPTRYVKDPEAVIDRLFKTVAEFRIPLLWVPPSRSVVMSRSSGEFVVRALWQSVVQHEF
jgi:hypothetical protein